MVSGDQGALNMLIFIENTPRAYAWGSRDALPALLGTAPTGEPQAELWLGDHPGAPASIAKASITAINVVASCAATPAIDSSRYELQKIDRMARIRNQ